MNVLTGRFSAIVLIVGAVITGVISLIQNVVYPDFTKDVHKPGFVAVNVISLIGFALVIYGLPMVYARYAQRWCPFAFTGVGLMVIAVFLFSFFGFLGAIVVPFVAEKAPGILNANGSNGPPGIFPLIIVGTLFTVIGPVLLASSILAGRTPAARWIAYVLIAAAVLAIPGFIVGGQNGVLANLVGSLNLYVVLVAFGGLAYGLLSPSREADRVSRAGVVSTS